VLWRVTPARLASRLAAALVIFVLAVSDFAVPAVLRVFTTEIFTAFAALDDLRATASRFPFSSQSSSRRCR
jgi:ABC-type Fe3+ transport system permease subunit